jgi:hypothetical protein
VRGRAGAGMSASGNLHATLENRAQMSGAKLLQNFGSSVFRTFRCLPEAGAPGLTRQARCAPRGRALCAASAAASPAELAPAQAAAEGGAAPGPFRSTAYPFTEIEAKWQAHWEAHQTFRTPDFKDLDTSKPKFYALDMFPYPRWGTLRATAASTRLPLPCGTFDFGTPDAFALLQPRAPAPPRSAQFPAPPTPAPPPQRRRPARGPPRGLHRHRHPGPLQAHARLQRAAPHGVGRLWAARGAVRHPDGHPPRGHHARQYRPLPGAAAVAGVQLRLGARGVHLRARVLPLDAVDLPAALRPRAGLPGGGARQLVPRPGHGAGQRGGDRRAVGAGGPPRGPHAHAPVDAAHHRLRRPPAGRPGPARLGRLHQGDAAQLDRPLRGRHRGVCAARRPLRGAARGLGARGVHHPPRHAVWRHLHGGGAGAPAAGAAGGGGAGRGGGGVCGCRRAQVGPGAHGAGQDQERRVHGLARRQPRHGRGGAGVGGRLRAGVVRQRGHHGGARPRRARL